MRTGVWTGIGSIPALTGLCIILGLMLTTADAAQTSSGHNPVVNDSVRVEAIVPAHPSFSVDTSAPKAVSEPLSLASAVESTHDSSAAVDHTDETPVVEVPIPPALWLFATALGALGFIRWHRSV